MVDSEQQIRDLADSLQADRLIDVYVGEITPDTKPFRVQQVLLEQLSDYFSSALRADAFVEGERGRLHFPEDDAVPRWTEIDGAKMDTEMLLVNCWVLGDKYRIHTFQDEVMLGMLMSFSKKQGGTYSCDVLKRGVELTSSGSKLRRLKLRRLMAEEVVNTRSVYGQADFDLDQFDGVRFLSDFAKAKEDHCDYGMGFNTEIRFGLQSEATLEAGTGGTWREYMVGNKLPRRVWKWDKIEGEWKF
ncbi:hypothetical protein B0A55_03258 [Friedmanniomyces simplex]|uniref:BTB domain-containing protein n=1 Tax=Friedmanniomyces simplex TaxID=329884 RepID=A0A4U0XMT6_9PEZI|nr:hypothetical protein B0A55_04560 [Friedmanniomyces simplex]TKA76145.1 hypothetical protein B0A55_03258 [Friedmanniomyces simplex]